MSQIEMLQVLEREAFSVLRPRRPRSFQQFSEEEIVLADGPKRGLRYRSDFMPFSKSIFEIYDRGHYRRLFFSGPGQAGKTLHAYIIPAMYHLFEIEEDIILGAPTIELAQSIYRERLLPSIRASRYEKYLPLEGAGSRGGTGLFIRFGNGASVRFIGAGGGDQQRSSYTARVIIMTEIDKMDAPGRASRESDPVTQIEARAAAFGDQARIYAECTMSTEGGRIHQEVMEFGTGSSPWFDCPHCGKPTSLERENFHGWEDAPDIEVARERAAFICPGCGKIWTERDRRQALKSPRILAKTQSVDDQGQVVGDPPPTNTFGFRWTALASSLVSMADIGEREFRAERDDNLKKALMQFTWTRPYSGELLEFEKLETTAVLKKIVRLERGVLPADTKKVTLAIDVGSYVCWWALVGWKEDASGHIADFGSIDVPQGPDGRKNPLSVLAALRAFRDKVIRGDGWLFGRRPDLVFVDSGYEHEVVYEFVRESGQDHYRACKGFGSSKKDRWHPARTSTASRLAGNEWTVTLQPSGIKLVEIHSDYWKGVVHDGFSASDGAPGSLTLLHRAPTEFHMKSFARQITAERRHIETPPGKEPITFWVVESRQNHYLDCMVYNRAAADMLGIKIIPIPKSSIKLRPTGTSNPNRGWGRDRY